MRAAYVAEYTVGTTEKHNLRMILSIFGKESYFVDGNLIKQQRQWWKLTSGHAFMVGKAERHHVEIRMKSIPPHGQLFIDCELVAEELFPELAEASRKGMKGLGNEGGKFALEQVLEAGIRCIFR